MSTETDACPYEDDRIPVRLHRRGRAINNTFTDDEWIYCRCRPAGYKDQTDGAPYPIIDSEGLIHEQHIRTQSQSVTRGRYCDGPEDALYDGTSGAFLVEEGVFGFQYGHVNGQTKAHEQLNSRSYKICVEHDPTPCIYPHSEVRVYQYDEKDNTVEETLPDRIKPASIKLWVIDTIRERAKVFRQYPESDSTDT